MSVRFALNEIVKVMIILKCTVHKTGWATTDLFTDITITIVYLHQPIWPKLHTIQKPRFACHLAQEKIVYSAVSATPG